MARKKEADLVNKNRAKIIEAAKELFLEVGVEQPQISTIANKAGMSKSTLYVYFQSKEEIIQYMTKEAMEYLYEKLKGVQEMESLNLHEVYMQICFTLVEFKEKYPLNFEFLVQNISIDETELAKNSVLMEIYDTGEKINQLMFYVVTKRVKNLDIQSLLGAIFTQWGSIYGLIVMAENKQDYIHSAMGLTKKEFLEQGFEQLYYVLEQGIITETRKKQ